MQKRSFLYRILLLFKQKTALITKMLNTFTQTFLRASGVFRETGQAEKFRGTAIYHLFVNADFIIRQPSIAFFTARLCDIVVHVQLKFIKKIHGGTFP